MGIIIVDVFQLMKEALYLQNLLLMVDLNHPNIHWDSFMECIDDNFLAEAIEEAKRGDSLLEFQIRKKSSS